MQKRNLTPELIEIALPLLKAGVKPKRRQANDTDIHTRTQVLNSRNTLPHIPCPVG
jgi:hypothetical protein